MFVLYDFLILYFLIFYYIRVETLSFNAALQSDEPSAAFGVFLKYGGVFSARARNPKPEDLGLTP